MEDKGQLETRRNSLHSSSATVQSVRDVLHNHQLQLPAKTSLLDECNFMCRMLYRDILRFIHYIILYCFSSGFSVFFSKKNWFIT